MSAVPPNTVVPAPLPTYAQVRRLAIMQPYFLPYLGYFQLIAAVDRFVIYDDVAFIKRGWINRNQILLNGNAYMFTVPLRDASQNRAIKDTLVGREEYERWCEKFLKTIAQCYSRAPHYSMASGLLRSILEPAPINIAELAARSIVRVCDYLEIKTQIVPTSTTYGNAHLHAEDRVIDICRIEGAHTYVNAQGGRDLYARKSFAQHGMDLMFLRSRLPMYPQQAPVFIPGLSILDILMHATVEESRKMLAEYELEP